jgi:NTE family protein
MRKFKIGIALGGGGARGLAHIGVLRALEKNSIKPGCLAGTSMGALIGAMYASGMNVDEIERKCVAFLDTEIYARLGFENIPQGNSMGFWDSLVEKFKRKAMYYLSDVKMAFMEKSSVDAIVSYFLPAVDFKELKIPFCCVAVDILRGAEVVMDSGPVRKAVASSMAIPGFLPPVESEKGLLVDGGVLQMVPVRAARAMGCDFCIGADVSSNIGILSQADIKSAFKITQRATDIIGAELNRLQIKEADFMIVPPVGGVKWFEMKKVRECMAAGERETAGKIADLKKKLRAGWWRTAFKRVF